MRRKLLSSIYSWKNNNKGGDNIDKTGKYCTAECREMLKVGHTLRIHELGGIHNMLRVRVGAAHMGGFSGPKFSYAHMGGFRVMFWQTFLKHRLVWPRLKKKFKLGSFLPKLIIKVGMKASFGN